MELTKFDPQRERGLDEPLRARPAGENRPLWIWVPGQRTAHIHKRILLESIRRCVYVGYPMSFYQPEYTAFFRTTLHLDRDGEVIWHTTPGRYRGTVDGEDTNITSCRRTMTAGDHDFMIEADFCETLPALYLEGPGCRTDGTWEASLDRKTWYPAECLPEFDRPDCDPMARREKNVTLKDFQVLSAENAVCNEEGISISRGRLVADWEYYEMGTLSFTACGTGTLTVQVGQVYEDAVNTDTVHFEQLPLPVISLTPQPTKYVLPERALRVVSLAADGVCHIDGLSFEAHVTPVQFLGDFTCDDSLVNTMWKAAASTIHACMHEYYMDGILRDGLVWGMDGSIGLQAGDYLFFDDRTSFNQALSQSLPTNAEMEDFAGGYLEYPMYAVLGMVLYCADRNDLAFFKTFRHRAYQIMELYLQTVDRQGYLNAKNSHNRLFFAEWGSERTGIDFSGAPTFAQMLFTHCLEAVARLSAAVEDKDHAKRYGKLAKDLRERIVRELRDPETGLFYNGFTRDGKLDRRISVYAQTYGAACGFLDEKGLSSLTQYFLRDTRPESNISLSFYWKIQAFLRAKQGKAMLQCLRTYLGDSVKKGFSHVLEDIRVGDDALESLQFYGRPYACSACHHVIADALIVAVVQGVLGVTMEEYGHRTCVFEPLDTGLTRFAGQFATGCGVIRVELADGQYTVTIPEGVTMKLHGFTAADGSDTLTAAGTYPLLSK